MKKKNFVTMILSTVGGILFAIGMCMCLLPEWNAFHPGVGMCMTMVWNMLIPGILVGVVGIVLLLCLIPLVKGLKG